MKADDSKCIVSVALVHHPVYNRGGDVVTTSVTSVDIHDIARACRTYGVVRYYLVTPILAQRDMIDRVTDHWSEGAGNKAGHPRGEALELVKTVADLAGAKADFEATHGFCPTVVVTSANHMSDDMTFRALRERMSTNDLRGILIVFGTGWGLTRELTDGADLRLEPIAGPTEYRHLSVRAAAAITLDRLMGIGIY
ncbi:MAG TPA: RNA methyltransferase [Myxococcota bacterium]|nr:RNA methyltransferase [Myxococcota bacterium]HOD07992.1 RNA methyltransferase [Myxococcota bacterium]